MSGEGDRPPGCGGGAADASTARCDEDEPRFRIAEGRWGALVGDLDLLHTRRPLDLVTVVAKGNVEDRWAARHDEFADGV